MEKSREKNERLGQPFEYNIVLIGFMGVGKSTISKKLSEGRFELNKTIN